jgi:hypothetical protein
LWPPYHGGGHECQFDEDINSGGGGDDAVGGAAASSMTSTLQVI